MDILQQRDQTVPLGGESVNRAHIFTGVWVRIGYDYREWVLSTRRKATNWTGHSDV